MKKYILIDDSNLPAGTKSRAGRQLIQNIRDSYPDISVLHIHATFVPNGFGQIAFAHAISGVKGVVGHIHTLTQLNQKSKYLISKALSFTKNPGLDSGDNPELEEPSILRYNIQDVHDKIDFDFKESHTYYYFYNLKKIYNIVDIINENEVIFGLKDNFFAGNGLDSDLFTHLLAQNIKDEFDEKFLNDNHTIWITVSSGSIIRALYKAFPNSRFKGVQTGMTVDKSRLEMDRTEIFVYPGSFYEDTSIMPPYNSLSNYDAKVWYFFDKYGKDGDIIWNVAGNVEEDDTLFNLEMEKFQFPYLYKIQDEPLEMLYRLKNETFDLDKNIVDRKYKENYLKVDSISNHFTEENRMKCWFGRNMSPIKYWNRHMNEYALSKLTIEDKHELLYSQKGFKECNIFNEYFCAHLYRWVMRMLNKRISILDPSSGWGDRLIAAKSVEAVKYHGYDIQNLGYNKIIEELRCGKDFKVNIEPFEKAKLKEKYDLVLTSPPYYNLEVYDSKDNKNNMSYKEWKKSFYFPYLDNMINGCRHYIIIYVSDFFNNNQKIPLEKDTIWYLKSKGLHYEGRIGFRQDGGKIRNANIFEN